MARLILLILLLSGCSRQATIEPVQAAVSEVATVVESTAGQTAPAVTATVLAVRGVADVVPSPTVEPKPVNDAVEALVVRWEIGSRAQYEAKYLGVICPGASSGPTIGIGYDLGQQTGAEIRRAWGWHPDVDALATASGQTGHSRCSAWRNAHRSIRVGYSDAIRVFASHDWPQYQTMAARAYRRGWNGLSDGHRTALEGNGYNRGFSFVGDRRREMRAIRDECVPGGSGECSATQLAASCRIWQGTDVYKGLCARRKEEARWARM